MRNINFEGRDYNVPDELNDEDAVKTILESNVLEKQQSGGGETAAPTTPTAPTVPEPLPSNKAGMEPIDHAAMGANAKINPANLVDDKEWMDASRLLYEKKYGVKFNGNQQELRDYGLNMMAFFNYNSASLAGTAAQIHNAPDDVKGAFKTLIEKFDNTEMSWAGTGRWLYANATDPMNWFGLETFGLSVASKAAATTLTKKVIKEALVGASVNALRSGAIDTMTQSAKIDVGAQKDFSVGELAKTTALGAGLGAAFSGASAYVKGRWFPDASVFKEPPPKPGEGATPNANPTAGATAEAAKTNTTLPMEYTFSTGHRVEIVPTEPRDQKYLKLTDITASERSALMAGKREAKKAGQEFDPQAELEAIRTATEKHMAASALGPEPSAAPIGKTVMDAVSEAAKDLVFNQKLTSVTKSELDDWSGDPIKILSNMSLDDAKVVGQHILESKVDENERTVLAHSIMQSTQKSLAEGAILEEKLSQAIAAGNAQTADTLTRQLAAKAQEAQALGAIDQIISSNSGRSLGTRANQINTGAFREKLTPEFYLKAANIDPAEADFGQKAWAARQLFQEVQERTKLLDERAEMQSINQNIKSIFDNWNDTKKQGHELVEALNNRAEVKGILAAADANVDPKYKRAWVSAWRLVPRYVIANVFSPGTVFRNTLPSAVDTFLDPILHGVARADASYTKAVYKSMLANVDTAWKMAGMAYKYEQSFITGDSFIANEAGRQSERMADILFQKGGKLNQYANSLFKVGDNVAMVIPRMLNATDEFFAQLQYHGYAVANAEEQIKRMAANIPESKRAAYIEKKMKDVYKNLFETADKPDEIAALIHQTGVEKGLRGKELEAWVTKEVKDNFDLFKKPTQASTVEMIERSQFKSKFSGETPTSKLAQSFEREVMNFEVLRIPLLRVFGQLFFRTPVRVAETGIRMTPFLGLISKRFRDDISGVNGEMAQNLATIHMLKGYAIAGFAMSAYGMGKLTGKGPRDPDQSKAWTASGNEPYTLTWGEHKINFKNYDPYSTAIKIIANVMDGLSEVDFERSRGKYDQAKEKHLIDMLFVATTSLGSAISDANLLSGVEDMKKLGEELTNPKGDSAQGLINFIGKKAQTFVPFESTIGKSMMAFNPAWSSPDPRTVNQFIEAKVAPWSPTLPHKHDALGNRLQDADPMGTLLGWHISNDKSRAAGRSEAEMKVLERLSQIGIRTGSEFGLPFKSQLLPGFDDLRTATSTLTGKNLYDEGNKLLKESSLLADLHKILVENQGMPEGSKDRDAWAAKAVKDTFQKHYDRVFKMLRLTEAGIPEALVKKQLEDFNVDMGGRDVQLPNYSYSK